MKKRNLMMLGAALTLGGLSQADAGRLSPTLLARAQKGDQTKVGVIVRFNLPNDERGRAQFKNLRAQLNTIVAQLGSAAGILGSANVKQATNLWLDQSIFLPLSPVEARRMAQLPFVSDVFENFKVQIPKPQRAVALSAAAAAPGEAWHLAKIGAPQAWAAGFKGQGVRIGHLDSGIDASHPQLNGKVAAFAEFNGEGERVNGAATRDTTNHGTHTAGLLVGDTVGVAPSAKVISALVLPNNEGTFAQVIAGMQYVLDPDNNADTDDGADIVNMSLGIPGTFDEFIVPVQNMIKAGVVPMFAIGNFGPTSASTGSPGNLPDAIGVGAVDRNGQVASFSSRGPVNWNSTIKGVFVKPDIAAPGVDVIAAAPEKGYAFSSGTSIAAAHVSGLVALMLEKNPDLDLAGVKRLLAATAQDLGPKGADPIFGAGRVNAAAAVARAAEEAGKRP